MNQSQVLQQELTEDPLERGYSEMSDAEAAASLNTADRTIVRPRRVDSRTVLNEFMPSASAADALLAKLETVAQANSLVARVLDWMQVPEQQGGGLDVGNARVRAIAPGLVDQSGIMQAEIDGLLALAEETVSRAAELGIRAVKPGHVQEARREAE